jgi:hypothetical protein
MVYREPLLDLPFQGQIVDSKFHPYMALQFGEINAVSVGDTGAGITVADMSFIDLILP